MRQVGRPPRWRSAEALQNAIDAYFKHCKGHIVIGEDGNAITDRLGQPVMVDQEPATVTGLALWLGFAGRQSLLNYQGKPQFAPLIERAKLRCEAYAESRLYDREGSRGAQFSLMNNYDWGQKIQIEGQGDQAQQDMAIENARLYLEVEDLKKQLSEQAFDTDE